MRRVLVLGGTGWLGGEVVRRMLDDDASVTCLARGSSAAPTGARVVRADRSLPGAYAALGGEWDHVVDLATDPGIVASAVAALAGRAGHWSYVSSVSVYRDHAQAGQDETAALLDAGTEGYGEQKVASEEAVTDGLGSRALIIRPGLIVGPGDPSDRFGYWPARFARGGRVVVPETRGRHAQVIDVADLADWICRAGVADVAGTVDAVGPPLPLADVLAAAAQAAGFEGSTAQLDDETLLAGGVRHWAGPGSLPLWLPRELDGMALRAGVAFLGAGGNPRPLHATLARVLADERRRGLGRARRSGLTPAEEAALGV